jgi:hypothetical protein
MTLSVRDIPGFTIPIKDATYPWAGFRSLGKSYLKLPEEPTFSSDKAIAVIDCGRTLINLKDELFPGSEDFVKMLAANPSIAKIIISSGDGDSLEIARRGVSDLSNVSFKQQVDYKGNIAIDASEGGIFLPLVIEDTMGMSAECELDNVYQAEGLDKHWVLSNLDAHDDGDRPTARLTLPYDHKEFTPLEIDEINRLIPFLIAQAKSAA